MIKDVKLKQDFQIGDTVYFIDLDYRFYEGTVNKIVLSANKTGNCIIYTASGVEFDNRDLGKKVFTSAEERKRALKGGLVLND